MRRTVMVGSAMVAHGAQVESVRLDKTTEKLALDAVNALKMEYAGVDLIRDAQGKFLGYRGK